MNSLLFAALAALTVSVPDYILKDRSLTDPTTGKATAGVKLNDVRFDSGVWTGWIYVDQFRTVCFDIAFTRVAATDVRMRCETAEVVTTAADAGFDVHELDIAAGTAQSYPMTWIYTTAATTKWSWCADNLMGKYVSCYFSNTAGGATDKATVTARGIAP